MATGEKPKPRLCLIRFSNLLLLGVIKFAPLGKNSEYTAWEAAGFSGVNVSFLEARSTTHNAPSPPGTWLMLI